MAGSPECEVQGDNNLVDRISQLPNEILGEILSLLQFKEAGRSSVLSKRWQDLWKLTGRLNFDASELRDRIHSMRGSTEIQKGKLSEERSKFRTWVNQVLRLHQGPSIEEFIVKFDLDASSGHDVDEWIKFMIQKRAKIIELDLSGLMRWSEFYTLSKECCDFIKSGSNLTNLINLRSLRLDYVNVDEGVLEHLLSKCPYLEVLSVRVSMTLVDLKVVGPSLVLKYLEITNCGMVENFTLCAPKLERFIYDGGEVKFFIGSNPRLTELDIGVYEDVTCHLVSFGHLLWQLETLTLRIHWNGQSAVDFPNFGELSNLKHLTMEFHLAHDVVLTAFTKLIVAAPVLAKFTLMFEASYRPMESSERKTSAIQPHGCLKEVGILGFLGGRAAFEMARYVLANAINLEKMVIDPLHPLESSRPTLLKRLASIDKYVKALKEGLATTTELTVVGM